MKEQERDGAEYGGFKQFTPGWHTVIVVEGIDYLKIKDGTAWQDERGNKAYKFTLKCVDEDENKDVTIDRIANTGNSGQYVADLLSATGLMKKVQEKFPDPNVTVFDPRVMEGVKINLPNKPFMLETDVNKEEKAVIKTVVSLIKYKTFVAEREAKHGKEKSTPKSVPDSTPAPPVQETTGW
jgi:hypothetical protein